MARWIFLTLAFVVVERPVVEANCFSNCFSKELDTCGAEDTQATHVKPNMYLTQHPHKESYSLLQRGYSSSLHAPDPQDPIFSKVPDLSAKDKVTLVFTDLGLGGLSIFSAVERHLSQHPFIPEVHLIYYNMWLSNDYFVTELSNEEQVRIFNSALQRMSSLQSDLIFIACNTLSTLYSKTSFAQTAKIPVVPIVPLGAAMFVRAMRSDDENPILFIFGTEVTSSSPVYTDMLASRGVSREHVIMQACAGLAGSIQENGAVSNMTEKTLSACVKHAWQKMISRNLGSASSIFFGLACTHYTYAMPLWVKAMKVEAASGTGRIKANAKLSVLDPNESMAGYLFEKRPRTPKGPSQRSKISIQVVSIENITAANIASIGPLVSAPVAHALKEYSLERTKFII